uniref:Isopenicillin N synthase-like Fe(2+) 2OG dioxygenase domain-containing protein n=3 Tax=Aegilops tauschii subsp. strangulata TaxID=200361 RepID=A0A453PF17_AEGTS
RAQETGAASPPLWLFLACTTAPPPAPPPYRGGESLSRPVPCAPGFAVPAPALPLSAPFLHATFLSRPVAPPAVPPVTTTDRRSQRGFHNPIPLTAAFFLAAAEFNSPLPPPPAAQPNGPPRGGSRALPAGRRRRRGAGRGGGSAARALRHGERQPAGHGGAAGQGPPLHRRRQRPLPRRRRALLRPIRRLQAPPGAPPPPLPEVGVTPEGVEVPRSLVDKEMQDRIKSMPEEFQPATPKGPDPKWRYMWRVGPRPSNTRFKELNAEPVIPDGLPEWKETMDSWGAKMISAIEVVAEMAAIGFGLSKDAFTSLMKEGPHLLAPTGSNLLRHGSEGTVFAGFHYDLNFLTIHGRSRFPGLNIWLRNGKKMEVKVPVGCLLIQSGKQLEWLTGGECLAGMHEVVVTKRTLEAIELAKEQNRSLWRISSTLFSHIASDATLKPLGHFAEAPNAHSYPPICAGEYVEQELSAINLKGKVAL